MNCEHSGGRKLQDRPRPLIAAIITGTWLCALGACALPGSPVASPACRSGDPLCPIKVAFVSGSAVIQGSLTADHGSASYAFTTKAPMRLQWSMSGPAVHLVLTHPDGSVDGPGLPAIVPLATAGRHVLQVSSNTMAEDIYGGFRLELRLLSAE